MRKFIINETPLSVSLSFLIQLNLHIYKYLIMKTNIFKTIAITGFIIIMSSCGGSTDVVDSGTYQGTVKEVEPDKTEIYVETTDGKTLELYFTDQTTLTQNGEPVEFSALQEGQTVEVEVEKVGKRLDPLSVDIR